MYFTICNIFTDFGRHKYPPNYFWKKIWTSGHGVGVWHPYKRLVFIHILATVNVLALPRPRLQCRRRIRKSRLHKEIRPLEGQGFAFCCNWSCYSNKFKKIHFSMFFPNHGGISVLKSLKVNTRKKIKKSLIFDQACIWQ